MEEVKKKPAPVIYGPRFKAKLEQLERKLPGIESDIVALKDKFDQFTKTNTKITTTFEKRLDDDQQQIMDSVQEVFENIKKHTAYLKNLEKQIESIQKTVTCMIICLGALSIIQFVMFLIR